MPKLGLDVRFVDIADRAAVKAAINDSTSFVFADYFQPKIGCAKYFTVEGLNQGKANSINN